MKFIDGEGAIYLKEANCLRLPKVQTQDYVLRQIGKHYILTALIVYTNPNCIYVRLGYWQVDQRVTCLRDPITRLSIYVHVSHKLYHSIANVLRLYKVRLNVEACTAFRLGFSVPAVARLYTSILSSVLLLLGVLTTVPFRPSIFAIYDLFQYTASFSTFDSVKVIHLLLRIVAMSLSLYRRKNVFANLATVSLLNAGTLG
jgi:hypothetical protein